MKIAVIGSGAIGCLVAGYLKNKGKDVSLVGHSDSAKAIRENGLLILGVRGNLNIKIDIDERLKFSPDLCILATKTQDIDSVFKDNLALLKESTVLTTQNGVQADSLVAKYIPKENIISSIVMFGATYLEAGEVIHNFDRAWVLGRIFIPNDAKVVEVANLLNEIFPTIVAEDIQGMKYLKIFANSNNCITAILGKSMQEVFIDPEISSISVAIWKEGLNIVQKSGINLVSLPDFSLEQVVKLTSLPTLEAAKIFSGIMTKLSEEPLYGSILQSIKRGRVSEIDYINGEFVSLARRNNFEAPLNEKLVEMVHSVEQTGKFFSKEELISNIKGLDN